MHTFIVNAELEELHEIIITTQVSCRCLSMEKYPRIRISYGYKSHGYNMQNMNQSCEIRMKLSMIHPYLYMFLNIVVGTLTRQSRSFGHLLPFSRVNGTILREYS